MKQMILNNIRVQFFNKNIIRLEEKWNGLFWDQNTFFIPNRQSLTETDFKLKKYDNEVILYFGDYWIKIPEKCEDIEGLSIYYKNQLAYKITNIRNSGELPNLDNTPLVHPLKDTPRIICPKMGYTQRSQDDFMVQETAKDFYLILCEKNAKLLREIYVELTGRNDMVRLSTLGCWNSRYFAYDDASARDKIMSYKKYNLPLDNMVIDTDWRKASDRGIGYDINTDLFPNMQEFLTFAHRQGVEVMFNDHPEPVDGADNALDKKEIAYREEKLQSLLKLGLDYWWYDRNWTTALKTPLIGKISSETIGLYLFTNITKNYYQMIGNNKKYIRPTIMGNVDNVRNGGYTLITNSASHRYAIQWTGDIESTMFSLGQEISTLIRCGINCIPYVSSDCGGFSGSPTKEEYLRWIQFGVFSPIFRPHCTNRVLPREPWNYDEETILLFQEYVNMRYQLLPMIYREAFKSYCTGEPIFKSLGFNYPNDIKCIRNYSSYMLGTNLLWSPICESYPFLFEKENYIGPVHIQFYNGIELKGEPIWEEVKDKVCFHVIDYPYNNHVPAYNFSAKIKAQVRVKKNTKLFVKFDDGVKVYINNNMVLDEWRVKGTTTQFLSVLQPNTTYDILIEYFQAGGEGGLELLAKDSSENGVYLPKGQWIYAFDGQEYQGCCMVKANFSLPNMPMFIKKGSLLVLAYPAENTKKQAWNKLIYDFYPSLTEYEDDYLYEDDTKTVAYQYGEYRKSSYQTSYDEMNRCLIVKLFKSKGKFTSENCYNKRSILFKYHLLKTVSQIDHVTLNEQKINYYTVQKKKQTMPINTEQYSCISDCIVFEFEQEIEKDYELKFFLKK